MNTLWLYVLFSFELRKRHSGRVVWSQLDPVNKDSLRHTFVFRVYRTFPLFNPSTSPVSKSCTFFLLPLYHARYCCALIISHGNHNMCLKDTYLLQLFYAALYLYCTLYITLQHDLLGISPFLTNKASTEQNLVCVK